MTPAWWVVARSPEAAGSPEELALNEPTLGVRLGLVLGGGW